MRQRLFILIFLAGSYLTAVGQFSIGLKGMYSLYDQAYKGVVGYPISGFRLDEKNFISGGFYLRYRFAPHIAIETSPFVSRQTNDLTTYISFANPQIGAPGSVSSDESRYALRYIQFPLMAEYHFSQIFHIGVGPQFGFLRKAELNDTDIAYMIHSNITSLVADVGMEPGHGLEVGFSHTHSYNPISISLPGSPFQFKKFNFWNFYIKFRIYSTHRDSVSDRSQLSSK